MRRPELRTSTASCPCTSRRRRARAWWAGSGGRDRWTPPLMRRRCWRKPTTGSRTYVSSFVMFFKFLTLQIPVVATRVISFHCSVGTIKLFLSVQFLFSISMGEIVWASRSIGRTFRWPRWNRNNWYSWTIINFNSIDRECEDYPQLFHWGTKCFFPTIIAMR